MTYKEWEKSFVNGGDKSGLQETSPDDTIKAKEEIKQVAEELKIDNFPDGMIGFTEMHEAGIQLDHMLPLTKDRAYEL